MKLMMSLNRIEKLLCQDNPDIESLRKAFVMIEITTPRGSNNPKVWDTSNRAINVIINNLKGIFFRDDDFVHMACGIVANWGENGQTIIRICELENLLGSVVFCTKINFQKPPLKFDKLLRVG